MGSAAWRLVAEIQSIKNGLDPYGVKAIALLNHAVDGGDGVVQESEAALYILNISPVFCWHVRRWCPAGKAQVQHAVVVRRRTAQDGAEGGDEQDDRGEDGQQDPAHSLAAPLIGQNRDRRPNSRSN